MSGFLGTLVWVNGRGAWFVMHFARLPSFAPSLSLAYTMWLVVYGLFGAAILHCFLMGGKWEKSVLTDAALLLSAYLLSLLWQPFFYSAHFLLLSTLTLTAAVALLVLFFLRMLRKSLWLTLTSVVILSVQIFFLVFTVHCF